MSGNDLRLLKHEELMALLSCQLTMAQRTGLAADNFRYINPPPDPNKPTPLVAFGDFEIWPRFE